MERTGWSITLVSSAVTVHFLCGAIFVANSSLVYERFGIAKVTFTGALLLALGVLGLSAGNCYLNLTPSDLEKKGPRWPDGALFDGSTPELSDCEEPNYPESMGPRLNYRISKNRTIPGPLILNAGRGDGAGPIRANRTHCALVLDTG